MYTFLYKCLILKEKYNFFFFFINLIHLSLAALVSGIISLSAGIFRVPCTDIKRLAFLVLLDWLDCCSRQHEPLGKSPALYESLSQG